jgi:hypothetical protein
MTGKHGMRIAIGLWLILLGVTCIQPLFRPASNTVFPIYAFAGSDFAAAKPLYDRSHPGTDIFRYSPLVAAFFEPFSQLPLGVAGSLWRILGAALFLTGLAAWARRACPDVSMPILFIVALPLSVGSLNNGQANVHMLGLMLWGTVLATRGSWAWAAVFLAAAALFKGYPIALGLLLALVAPLRFGLPLAVAIAAGCALPYLLQDDSYVSSQYRQWYESVAGDDRSAFPLHLGYQDAHMLLRVLGFHMDLVEYRLVQVAAGAAAAGVIASQLWKGVRREHVALNALTLGLCWMTTFGTGFILLAPVMARELLDRTGRPRWAAPFAWLGGGLFFTSVVLFAFPHEVHRPAISLGLLPVAALMVSTAAVARVLTVREVPAVGTDGSSRPMRRHWINCERSLPRGRNRRATGG